MIVPVTSPRLLIAMDRALVTSAAVGEASMDQPTTRRSNDQNLWMALGGAGVRGRTFPSKI